MYFWDQDDIFQNICSLVKQTSECQEGLAPTSAGFHNVLV